MNIKTYRLLKRQKLGKWFYTKVPKKYLKYRKTQYNKYLRKIIREYQSKHGKLPDLKSIPPGYYCHGEATIIEQENNLPPIIKYEKRCPFHYFEEVPIEKRDDCIALVMFDQSYVGGCKLLNITDHDLNGYGLLWDECKECGINVRD
jgi:hypothetical protein